MNIDPNNIDRVLSELENQTVNGYQTVEEKTIALNNYIQTIVDSKKVLLEKIVFLEQEVAIPDKYNKFFSQAYSKINYIFNKLSTFQSKLQKGVDSIGSEANLIMQDIKVVRSLLNTISLYNRTSDDNIFYFDDTFADFNKLNFDIESGPVTNNFVLTDSGVVTLPRKTVNRLTSSSTSFIRQPNTSTDLAATTGKTLSVAFDTNTEDWAEYYLDSDLSGLTVKFAFLIVLDDVQIINNIRIEPNNFGTSNWLKINKISTSENNIAFTDIQDLNLQFKVVGVTPSLENELILSAYTNKFTRVGDFAFEPTKAKYVYIEVEQNEPISTPDAATAYRYLIGFRNIEINQIIYDVNGSFYSKVFNRGTVNNNEIGSISLSRTTNLTNTSIAGTIQFYVSPDNQDWYTINDISDNIGNEILYFNQPWLTGNISIDAPITNLYVKADFKNELVNLNENPTKIVNTVDYSEVIQLGDAFPYVTELTNTPKDNEVQLLMYPYGTIGQSAPITLQENLTTTPNYIFELPYTLTENPRITVGDHHLYYSEDPGVFSTENSGGTNQGNYSIKAVSQIIKNDVGETIDTQTYNTINIYLKYNGTIESPEYWWEGEDIFLKMESFPVAAESLTDAEKLKYPDLANLKAVRLDNYCDGIADRIEVWKVNLINGERDYSEYAFVIPPGTRNFRISPNSIKPFTSGEATGGLTIDGSFEVDFIDGNAELVPLLNCYAFSVNYNTGEVFQNFTTTAEISVRCLKENKTKIAADKIFILPDNKTILISLDVYDSTFFYEVTYGLAVPISPAYYSVKDTVLTLTDQGKVISHLNALNQEQKLIKASYKYEETATEPLIELADYFTPILKDYTITCTGLRF